MSDLNDWVESLKRSVATPGEFETFFPDTTDDDLVGSLLDAFGECQLDGFFLTTGPGGSTYAATDAGVVTPDVTRGQVSLIIIYAACRIIQTQLLNLKNRQHYEAKGAVFETEQASNVLTAILKQFSDRKLQIISRLRIYSASAAFAMADGYLIKATDSGIYYGGELDRAYDYHSPFGNW